MREIATDSENWDLANLTLFSAAIPGPEQYLGGHPLMVVTMVFVQIVATLVLVDVLATRTVPDFSNGGVPREPHVFRA